MKQLSILVCMLWAVCIASAQVNFVFVPAANARTVDGLGIFQVQNLTGQPVRGNVVITVSELANQKAGIVTIKTPLVTLPAGLSQFVRSNFTSAVFSFSNNAYASIVSQTRNFPPGEYSYCYLFVPEEKMAESYESCFEGSVQPLVPIQLLNPADLDTICQKRPVLSWQPPMPFSTGMRFRLLLTEKKAGTSIESLLSNAPLVLLDNISTTSVSFPASSPDLKEGHTYCWQVIAYQQGVVISRSEIWEFTVQCKEQPPVKTSDSYRELRELANGNYYVANRYISFMFNNNYNQKKLVYEILPPQAGGGAVKNTPGIYLNSGMNKIDIDVSDLGLVPGKIYTLKVYPFNELNIEVRFIYQDTETPLNR